MNIKKSFIKMINKIISEGKGMNLLTANMRREKEGWEKNAREEEKILIAQRMKSKGMELNLISSITGLKIEKLQTI